MERSALIAFSIDTEANFESNKWCRIKYNVPYCFVDKIWFKYPPDKAKSRMSVTPGVDLCSLIISIKISSDCFGLLHFLNCVNRGFISWRVFEVSKEVIAK